MIYQSKILLLILASRALCIVSSSNGNNSHKAITDAQKELLSRATILSNNLVNEQPHRSLNDNDDDYIVGDELDLDGFSLKYEKCQTVQRFSEDAIKNGEYSAMVKDDIVVLRLCPANQCNSNYGCHYNYIEYAIDIIDYVKVMLKYTINKREKMCDFCAECGYRRDRKLNEGENKDRNEEQGGEEQKEEQEQNEMKQEEDEEEEAADEDFDDDDYYKGVDDDNAGAQNNYDDDANSLCSSNYDSCQEISNWCQGAADDDVGYLDYADYLDYLDCVKVEGVDNYGDAAYWIRPRCDSSEQNVHMDIFYDPYCSQYAGNDVNIREFSGIYFRKSLFSDFTDGNCIDCSETNYGPYYDSNHYMCNRIHSGSAICDKNLMTELYDNDDDDNSIACSFIESVQGGTYNSKGEIYVDTSVYGEKVKEEVTPPQRVGLAISILLCLGLGLYSCYLHHSITNLLIKSLSHSHLLPPSRHRNRSRSRSSSRRRNKSATPSKDDDWDHTAGYQS